MRIKSFNHQRGAATILMSVLVGFSITAMGLAVMMGVQSAQDKQITAQAQVNAQGIAWAGSEAFRQILAAMPDAELKKLTADSAITDANDGKNKLRPDILSINEVPAAGAVKAHKEIIVNFAAQDTNAQVGTNLQVVYNVFSGAGRPKIPPPTVVVFNDNGKLEGTVDIRNPEGKSEVLTVNGKVNATSKITGISAIFATGDVVLRDNQVREIKTNGTVTLGGSAQVTDELVGRAGVNIEEGYAGSVKSNGDIFYKPSRPKNVAAAVRPEVKEVVGNSVTITNQHNTNFLAVRSKTTASLSGNCDSDSCYQAVEAGGALTINLDKANTAASAERINCSAANQLPVTRATAPVFNSSCGSGAKMQLQKPSLLPINYIEEYSLEPRPIDVWDSEKDVNYLIRIVAARVGNASVTRTLVTVKNVKRTDKTGALDGEYEFVGSDKQNTTGYLCPLDNKGVQLSNCAKDLVFCTNGCWEPESKVAPATQFNVKGFVAPGVILFDGNVVLKGKDGGGNNISAASLLASGFIRTEGDVKSVALNFAGPKGRSVTIPKPDDGNPIVESRAKVTVALPGVCENLPDKALNLIPSNFCEEGKYNSTTADNLGNVALMAGGAGGAGTADKKITTTEAAYVESDKAEESSEMEKEANGRNRVTRTKIVPDAVSGKTFTTVLTDFYKGGDIQIAAKNVVFGSVLAGNIFRSEGQSNLYGYLVSSSLAKAPTPAIGAPAFNYGGLGLVENQLTSQTLIDRTIESEYYRPEELPGGGGGSDEGNEGAGAERVKVVRARYL